MTNNRKLFIISLIFLAYISISVYPETESVKSLNEERIETIKFGIDTQVIDLIDTLKKENDYTYNDNFLEILKTSTNDQLKMKILNLFELAEYDKGSEIIFNQLEDDYNLPDSTIVAYIKYISKYQTKEMTTYLLDLVENESNTVSIAAINALSLSSDENVNSMLIELLEDSLFDELRKPAIVETLGKLKATEALDILTDLATDTYTDNKSLRWKAVVALGAINADESLEVLRSLFSDKDPYLRNYTISALKHYPSNKVSDLLIQGLKDSSWRVRVNAAESIGELKIKEAVPILIYKGKNDPDIKNVRTAALKALGEIGTSDSYIFLREIYGNERGNVQLRSIAIEILAEKDLRKSMEIINKVIKEEWDKDNSVILDYTCNVLSKTKSKDLKDIYGQMLGYDKSINLKLYALRGIKLNKLGSFKSEVESLTEDDVPNAVRKLALDVIKEL